jgi:hypothetical protein
MQYQSIITSLQVNNKKLDVDNLVGMYLHCWCSTHGLNININQINPTPKVGGTMEMSFINMMMGGNNYGSGCKQMLEVFKSKMSSGQHMIQ